MSSIREYPFINFIMFLTLLGCGKSHNHEGPNLSMVFENRKPCHIVIKSSEVIDSLHLTIEHEDYLIMKRFEEYHLCQDFQDTAFQFDLVKPEIIRFTINNKEIPVFAYPGLENVLNLQIENDSITQMSVDKHQSLTDYYSASKRTTFNNVDGEWAQVEEMVSEEYLKKKHLLDSFHPQLPMWFYEFEKTDLELSYYRNLISGYTYRNQMLGYTDSFPAVLKIFLDTIYTISLFDKENYLNANYSQVVFAKMLQPELENQTYFDTSYPIARRHQLLLDRISTSAAELQTLPSELQKNFILHFYCAMNRSSRRYPEELLLNYFIKLDPVRQQFASEVADTKKSLDNLLAPNFTLKTMDDTFVSLSHFLGKPIWISFWFTGCKPCIKEFPSENKLVEKYQHTDMQFISICTVSDEEDWKKIIQEHNLKTINLFANENWSRIISDHYKITSYPKWTLIDKTGKIIRERLEGPGDPAIDEWIEKVL